MDGLTFFVAAVALLLLWLFEHYFWQTVLIASLIALGNVVTKLSERHAAASATARAKNALIAHRADEQNELFLGGDQRGLYGVYPPSMAGPEAALRASGHKPLPGRKPTLRGAIESQTAAADQRAIREAGAAARGRVLIDQFVAAMTQNDVPTETIYRECRGPARWTYDKVAGKGWMLEDRGSDRRPTRYHYIMPGQGIAEVVRRLPERKITKVLRYGTQPDNSDQAFAEWSARATQLAHQAREMIGNYP